MDWKNSELKAFAAMASFCVLGMLPAHANTGSYHVIYSFCQNGEPCPPSGANPDGLIADSSGNLYGVTSYENTNGVVYELAKGGSGFTYKQLYAFCSQLSCADGEVPTGKLVIDTSGNLYGTTEQGGATGYGTIYRLSYGQSGWSLTTLWNFCQNDSCKGGSGPVGGMTYAGAGSGTAYDGLSPLFGAAQAGGAYGGGSVYRLKSPAGTPSLKALYSFCPTAQCATGQYPEALVADSNGNLFGAAQAGGLNVNGCPISGCGLIFEVSPSGTSYSFTTLYSFCQNNQNQTCMDANNPSGPLVLDAQGNLYGPTLVGGAYSLGTIFKITPNGASSSEGILYSFCGEGGACANTGEAPRGVLYLSATGQLYGTTTTGGQQGFGTLFKLSGSVITTLYNFCSQVAQNQCLDGKAPAGGVASDGAGNLFGTPTLGGSSPYDGLVFEWSP